jgi:hypothetical protein
VSTFAYIETTIPAGVTAAEFRAALPCRSRRFRRLRRLLGL